MNKQFDKLYGKSLQGYINAKKEYESLCNISTYNLEQTKQESFLQI